MVVWLAEVCVRSGPIRLGLKQGANHFRAIEINEILWLLAPLRVLRLRSVLRLVECCLPWRRTSFTTRPCYREAFVRRWCVNLTLVGTVRLRRHGFCEAKFGTQRFWFIHGRRSEHSKQIGGTFGVPIFALVGCLVGILAVVRELKRTSDCVASEIYTGQ